jgi:Spy/CpxP family protein refolding chaperone
MRTTLLKAIAFLALAGMAAAAQRRTPPDPAEMVQHRVDFLAKRLSLNAQQQQQATDIYTEEASNAKRLHEQLRTAHQDLHSAIQKNDAAAIEQASDAIGNLTAQMTLAHAKAEAALWQTLTPEQQSKLSDMESHRGPGMHGHGWRGGPPPGAFFK